MANKDPRKVFILDGNKFSNLEGFYREFKTIIVDPRCLGKSSFNFHALNDILRGGFGKFDREEKIIFIWKNSAKSKKDLAARNGICDYFEPIIDVFKHNPNIEVRLQ